MSNSIIDVHGLSKEYRIGAHHQKYDTFREMLIRQLKKPFVKSERAHSFETILALKDVSFEVKKGEILGIIGRNGAGKSTILKILSRITEPTKGRIEIRGRVASLLEVGTGFHPELTGRENIYLNGAILGMRKKEISAKFDEIVSFAEIEKFVDTPVKYYSSGMYVRLAFAVAAHLEPEILIVDEVLAVGDVEFQKKCLGKMQDIASGFGRTVLFVSHNMQAISTLAHKCILLIKGQITKYDITEKVIQEYMNYGIGYDRVYTDQIMESEPKITKVEIITSEPGNIHIHRKSFEVHFELFTPHPIKDAMLAFQIFNKYEQPIVHFWLFDSELEMCRQKGVTKLKCKVPCLRLFMGMHSITVYFSKNNGRTRLQELKNICFFEVVMHGHVRDYEWQEGTSTYLDEFSWSHT